ncbi:MAG: leucine-rich repeat protein [Clostridia bacterium]|nr:leucine-rich repeat protein [Clostridia bacterium]
MKRILSALLAAVMLMSASVCASANETDDTAIRGDVNCESLETFGNYEYELNDTGVTITAYHGNDVDLSVPTFINGKWVTKIDMFVFQDNKTLKSVILPDTVTEIMDMCFWGCSSMESISLPSKLNYVGNSAFHGCSSLKSVSFPRGLTYLGSNAFDGCTSLKEINIESGSDHFMSENGVLFDNTQKRLVIYPPAKPDTNYTVPQSVIIIDSYAFSNANNLKTVNLPEGLVTIDMCGFYYCKNITEIPLPKSLKTLEFGAFMGCESITECIIPNDILYIGQCVFNGCLSLENIQVLNLSYRTIDGVLFKCGEQAMELDTLMAYPCAKQDDVYALPMGLKKVDDYAFMYNKNLRVIFGSGTKAVGFSSFAYCESLESIEFGVQLKEIGAGIVMGCKKLQFISVDNESEYFYSDDYGFFSKDKTKLYAVPNQCHRMVDHKYYVPDSVKEIESFAFAECDNIEEVFFSSDLNDHVEKISTMAFYNCTSLRHIEIPTTVTEIEMLTFIGCRSLEEITIPASVTIISDANFDCNEYLVVKGYAGSQAEKFAEARGYTFVNLDEKQSMLIGDVDGDYKITAKDSMKTQRSVIGLAKLDMVRSKLADVNDDGKVDNRDALDILRYTIGLSKNERIGKLG